MKLAPLTTAVGLLCGVVAHGAAQTAALEHGSMLIGGTAGAQWFDEGHADNSIQVIVLPRLEYFVLNGLAVGGEIGLSYGKQGDVSSTGLSLGPAITYYMVQEGKLHPYVRATATYVRSKFSTSDESTSGTEWTGAAGLLLMLVDAVGLDAQLFVSRADSPIPERDDVKSAGLRLGISAFVF